MKLVFTLCFMCIMSANINRRRIKRGATKMEPSRFWSQIDEGDNKIVIPWSIEEGHPYKAALKLWMDILSKDLGCMKTMFIEREQLNSTIWKQGILFIHDQNNNCESYVGVVPGGAMRSDIDSPEQFGAHSTWQIISTNSDALYTNTVHHEVLHALGLRHEHSYPDRDDYLQFKNGNFDHNYKKYDADDWIGTEFPFEMQSVMIYTNNDKFTKKSGEPVAFKSPRLTTTDALQIQELYCKKNPKFEYKEHVMCASPDELGFNRPVFVDRICDGIKDCHDGSDENESMFQCRKHLGCCEAYYLWDETTGNPLTKFILQPNDGLEYKGYSIFGDQPESLYPFKLFGKTFAWVIGDDILLTDEDCPPVEPFWSSAMRKRVTLECAHQRLNKDHCSKSSCDINAHCISEIDSYSCECNYGFTGDGKFCSEIIEIDECHSREHDCSENALCIDQQYGYTCQCNEGFIDRDSARPGRKCESLTPSSDCCEKFGIWFDSYKIKFEFRIMKLVFTLCFLCIMPANINRRRIKRGATKMEV